MKELKELLKEIGFYNYCMTLVSINWFISLIKYAGSPNYNIETSFTGMFTCLMVIKITEGFTKWVDRL